MSRDLEVRVSQLAVQIEELREDVREIKMIVRDIQKKVNGHTADIASLQASRHYTWAALTLIVGIVGALLAVLWGG